MDRTHPHPATPAAPNAHYGGLAQDLHLLTERRKALRWLAVGTSVPFSLWGCGGGSSGETMASLLSACCGWRRRTRPARR